MKKLSNALIAAAITLLLSISTSSNAATKEIEPKYKLDKEEALFYSLFEKCIDKIAQGNRAATINEVNTCTQSTNQMWNYYTSGVKSIHKKSSSY